MSRLPFWFMFTGLAGFVLFHAASLFSLYDWMEGALRGPDGWFHVHLFVLGWATILAMGAVYQLISVILQANLYSERLGYIHYAVFTFGTAGLLYGFLGGKPLSVAFFALFALAGILFFAWNIGTALIRASRWNVITLSAACAVLYLVLAALAGTAMGVHFHIGGWPELHDRLFGAHIWFGAVGWFGLLITGFSYKMLPMFYLTHHDPIRLRRAVFLLWNAGVIAGAAFFLFDWRNEAIWPALLSLAAALILYGIYQSRIRQHRHKRSPGIGIVWTLYVNRALAMIVPGVLIYALIYPQELFREKPLLLAGWIYLGGWVSLNILGYLSKIMPFLWWTYRYGPKAGKPGVPTMADLLDEKKAGRLLALNAVALIALVAGLMLEAKTVIAVAGTAHSLVSFAYIGLIALVLTK